MELALNLNYEENDLIQACIRKDRDAQQLLYKANLWGCVFAIQITRMML
jgi:hypothetical protein